jgi:RNA polymerase sigma factor (sigma-70 family)
MREEVRKANWQEVWSRFQSGDKEAFAILYDLHINALYSYGAKLCKDEDAVKDALQEVFMDLYLRRNKLNLDYEKLKYYLLLALKRSLIKKMEAGRKLVHRLNDSTDFQPDYSIEFQMIEYEKDEEIRLKVVKALNQLPAGQKEAIYLRYNESLEYSEVAQMLNITVESVRKQVFRALKTIRKIIDNQSITILFSFFHKKS